MADFDLSMAITADGEEAANEIGLVDSRVKELDESQKQLEGSNRRLTLSAKELAAQQKANADAINAVVRATNPAVGSQRALDAALRKVESAYLSGKVSAELFARAQSIASNATFASATNMRQQQQGVRQLGLQFNDLGTQIASGISPMVAFTQQAGQVGYAMSQMGGTAGKFGSFLAGGWGALILVGASVLSNFIGKLVEGKKATENLSEAMKLHKLTTEELTKALKDEADALGKTIQTEQQAQQAALDSAEAKRQEVIQRRQNIQALLEEAVAQSKVDQMRSGGLQGQRGETAAIGAGERAGQLANLQAALAENTRQLAQAMQNVRVAQIPIDQRKAEAKVDKSKAEEDRHTEELGKLNEAFKHARISQAAYDAALDAETVEHKRNVDKLKEDNRKPRQVSLGDQVSATVGQNILAAAQSHMGQTDHSASLAEFLKGQNIDPEKSAWCAAFINAVLSSQGIKGSGSNAASSFLNYGSATNTPQAGDIVVLKSSRAPSGMHVGLFAGEQGGRVNVTGGNQGTVGGGQVKQSSFPLSSVLAFRRAPTASDQFKDDQEALAKADKLKDDLAKFGQEASQKLADLGARAVPQTAATQAKQQLTEIDRLMGEVEKRKPANLEQLRKDAEAAKAVIRSGITQPFDDYLKAQQQSLNVQQLRTAGLNAEADTLAEVYKQEAAIGQELLPEQVRQIYLGVKAREAEVKATAEAQKQQQKYVQDLNQYKDVFRSLFSGNSKDITSFPKRFLDVVKQQAGDKLFDQVFGGIFKQLEDDKTGAGKVKAANVKLANSADQATKAILGMAQAAQTASGALPGADGTGAPQVGDEVAKGIGDSPLGGIIGKLGKGIGLSDATISSLTTNLTKGFKGAATGAMVQSVLQPLGKVLGIQTSSTGAQIGGALGSFLPFPGGDIVGSIIGSVVGGLFKKKKVVPTGGVSLSDAFSDPTQGGQSALSSQFVGTGMQIQDSLQNIAEQLGGALGSFKVAIGTFDGDIRVNTDGLTAGKSLNRKTPGTHDFNDDMAAAVAFAIMDAIKDGAVTGLSAAVTKALHSSSDLDRSLREALKTRDLELQLKGVSGAMEKAFTDFEFQAKDRLRIAKAYGLDQTKTEELNAKQRADLFKETLNGRIGDLQNFLDSLHFGDLFEGTASDQRQALLQKIAGVRTQADQGVDGAASQLAQLESQLVQLSRTTFGTAGPEFTTDRATAEADANRIIAEETQRAQEAQQRAIDSLAAQNTNNTLTDETNSLLAGVNSRLDRILAHGGNPAGVNAPNQVGGSLSSLLDRSTAGLRSGGQFGFVYL